MLQPCNWNGNNQCAHCVLERFRRLGFLRGNSVWHSRFALKRKRKLAHEKGEMFDCVVLHLSKCNRFKTSDGLVFRGSNAPTFLPFILNRPSRSMIIWTNFKINNTVELKPLPTLISFEYRDPAFVKLWISNSNKFRESVRADARRIWDKSSK